MCRLCLWPWRKPDRLGFIVTPPPGCRGIGVWEEAKTHKAWPEEGGSQRAGWGAGERAPGEGEGNQT